MKNTIFFFFEREKNNIGYSLAAEIIADGEKGKEKNACMNTFFALFQFRPFHITHTMLRTRLMIFILISYFSRIKYRWI